MEQGGPYAAPPPQGGPPQYAAPPQVRYAAPPGSAPLAGNGRAAPKLLTAQDQQDKLLMQGGLFLFSLLALVPVMNCMQLMMDENLSFWIGPGFAWMWIFICLGLVAFYFVTVHVFIRMAAPEERKPAVSFMIFRTFVGLLGILLIAQSFPIADKTNDTAELLTYNCEADGRASSLHSYYHRLGAIRTDDSCKDSFSVEQCTGWMPTEYNNYIFWMENSFHCSGICPGTIPRLSPVMPPAPAEVQKTEQFTAPAPGNLQPVQGLPEVAAAPVQDAANAGPVAPANSGPNGPNALFARHHRAKKSGHVDHVTPLGLLGRTEKFARTKLTGVISESLSMLETAEEMMVRQPTAAVAPQNVAASAGLLGGAQTGGALPPVAGKRPNALFSRAHYEHRCGLMIAMDLRNRGKALSDTTFANGIALFMVSIFSAALELGIRFNQRDASPGVDRK